MYRTIITVILATVLASGCSSMKPIEMSPDEVQQKISAGEVLGVGDTVKIATRSDEVYEFKVTAISDDEIVGDDIAIPIEEVIAIETKEFSVGKTAALTGGTVVLWAIIVAVALGGTLTL